MPTIRTTMKDGTVHDRTHNSLQMALAAARNTMEIGLVIPDRDQQITTYYPITNIEKVEVYAQELTAAPKRKSKSKNAPTGTPATE